MKTKHKAGKYRSESFRLWVDESEHIDRWLRESGQDRASYFRAATRLLREHTHKMDFEEKAKLIVRLSLESQNNA